MLRVQCGDRERRDDRPGGGAVDVVVKDYARRGAFVRGCLAPLWIARELAILRRLAGVDGVPVALGRVDAHAFAMSWLDGVPLRRREFGGRLPEAFFAALEQMLDALAERGLLHLDLSSPTNVLVRPDGTPALVDLASAVRVPAPYFVRRALERRALAKLERRFALGAPEPLAPDPANAGRAALKVGASRLGFIDRGPVSDPEPVVLLAGADSNATALAPHVDAGVLRGRRVLAIDPPDRHRSAARKRGPAGPALAALYGGWLDALRLRACVVVGFADTAPLAADLAHSRPATRAHTLTVSPDPHTLWQDPALRPLSGVQG